MKNKLLQKGFTLIELLLVIAILGILSAGLLIILNPVSKIHQANDSNVKGDLNIIAEGLSSYFTNQANQAYPSITSGDLTYPFSNDSTNVLVASSELKSLPPTVIGKTIGNCSAASLPATTTVCYTPASGTTSPGATCGTDGKGPCEAVFAEKLSTGKWWCWDSTNQSPSELPFATIQAAAAVAAQPKCH